MTFREKLNRLKLDIPALFLALKEQDTPVLAKVFAGITVAYALSPVDLIPDFIPVLGYLDDLLLLPLLAAIAIVLIPKEVRARCREKAAGLWADGKPKRWYYAIPIVAFWVILLLALALKLVSKA